MSLALGTYPEKFQPMGDFNKMMSRCQSLFKGTRKTIVDLDDGTATGADEVVMVMIRGVGHEFPAGSTVTEINSLDDSHLGQGVEISIDRREVAIIPE